MKVESSIGRSKTGSGAGIDFSGTWKNELASQMTVTQNGAQLSGTYESAVSGSHLKTVGDLLGYADGKLLSVVVHWRDFQAITAWVGQLSSDGMTLNTLWQMVKEVDAGDEWAAINAGSDQVSRV